MLGVERVEAEDDFFALGGSSLTAMQIVAYASDAFGVEIALDALFDAPTVAGFARQIEAAGRPSPTRRGFFRRREPERAGVSEQQQSAWATKFYNPANRSFVDGTYLLEGPLDVAALERALSEVVRRHDILHTVFPAVDGRPTMRVLAPEPVRIPIVTLGRAPPRKRDADLREQVDAACRKPLDYEARPPFRVRLFRLGPRSHVLLLLVYELACDGWGFEVLLRELSVHYDAFVAGRPSPFAGPAPQYADVVRAQRARTRTASWLASRAYWDDALARAPLTLAFPFEHGGMPPTPGGHARASGRVPGGVVARLATIAREQTVTSFMLYLAALAVLLHRHSGATQMPINSPAASRSRAELEHVIGYFAQVLPLCIDLGGDPSFRTLLRRTRATTLAAFEHADAVAEDNRVRALPGVRGLRASGVQFRLWDATLEHRLELAGIRTRPILQAGEAGHLTVAVTEQSERQTLIELGSSSEGLDKAMLEALLARFQRLLASVAEHPDQRVSELDVLTDSDRRQLVVVGGRDAGAKERRLDELVAEQARRTPQATAIQSAAETLSYAELDARAERLAGHLRAHGVARGSTVGLSLAPSAELVVALLAVLKAGGACVPLDDADALAVLPETDVLVVDGSSSPARAARAARAARSVVDVAAARDSSAPGDPGAAADRGAAADPGDLAFIAATAGVSGPARAVELTHGALARAIAWRERTYRLSASDCAVHVPGAGGLTWALTPWAYLANGARVAIPDDVPASSDGAIGRWIRARGATIVALPAPLASAWFASPAADRSGVRAVLAQGCGRFALPDDLRRGDPDAFREYHLLEAGGAVFATRVRGTAQAWDALPSGADASVELHVCDAYGGPVPPGAVGELCVGAGTPASSLVRTGDNARRRADGSIEFLGPRCDDVWFRGFRLNGAMHELETALASHPNVDAAVTCWDAADDALVACVVSRRDPPDPRDLDHWLRERVVDWVLPGRYAEIDAIPLRRDGSPDRQALARTPLQALRDAGARAARSGIERRLEAIWKKVLGARSVDPHDNFFALGGLIVQGIEMTRRATAQGIPLAPHDLLIAQTISELAELVDRGAA